MLGHEEVPVGRASTSRRLLARLRDVMAGPDTGQRRLDQIVRMIAVEIGAEVCSCYVMRPGEVLELFATVGLNPQAIHHTRLRVGEGIVGEVAAQAVPQAVADVRAHPNFAYRPETGEDPFQSLLGVPILRGNRVRGVLAIQHREHRHFTEEEIEILQTVAMVVAELLVIGNLVTPNEASSLGDRALMPARLGGISLNRGIGIGLAVLHRQQFIVHRMFGDDPEEELERFRIAVSSMHTALDALVAGSASLGLSEPQDILESYRMIAEDRGWLGRIREAIWGGLTAEAAVVRVQSDTRARMSQLSDAYIRERMFDFDDLAYRLLQHLEGKSPGAEGAALPADMILVARSLGPAELLDYAPDRLRGLVLEEGSPTSHVTIVARALEIPVVGQLANVTGRVEPLEPLIVDGDSGQVYIRPAGHIEAAFAESRRLAAMRDKLHAEVRHLPSVSRDGVQVSLHLNCGMSIDLTHLHVSGADGIGLYRTEIPFMVHSTYPDVETQTTLYGKVLDEAGSKPVIFRTLDVGGDKRLPYFATEIEDNPALGWRAIRMGLDRPALLRRQLRALILAAAGRPLGVMFPMVSVVDEFDAARGILDLELERQHRLGLPMPCRLAVGAMIEVPALLWQLESLLARVDFVSVGSNDLTQYLFAADRGNPRMANRYDSLSPAMLSALGALSDTCRAYDKPFSLCGEMAGSPLDAMALIGIGFRSLSMAPQSVGRVKSMVRSLDVGRLSEYIAFLRRQPDRSYREKLRAYAIDHGVSV